MQVRNLSLQVARFVATMVVAAVAVLSFTSIANAQDASAEDASSIGGTIFTGRGRDRVPVEGVSLTVTDDANNEIGSAVTDAEGVWKIEVPGIGEYFVTLDVATLPDGVTLAQGRSATVAVTLSAPGNKSALFALSDGSEPIDQGGGEKTVAFVQLFVDGIKFGLIIAMCAVGLSLIYGTTGLVNFAHGEMVTLGAMTAYVINVTWAAPGIFGSLVFGALVAVLVTGLAGFAFNAAVWKPLRDRGASLIAALVVSIGFSILLRYIYLLRFGGRAGFYRDYQIQSKWYFFGLFGLTPKEVVIMTLSVLVLVGVALGLERTRAGKAMRAVADNRDLAESSGIDVESVIKWVWISGSALAGLGGVFFGLSENINWEMGFRVLLLMFAGITLGGLGTAYGALFGSLIIGVFIQLSTLGFWKYPGVAPDLKNVGALLILVLILLFRPQGLFGRAERIG